MLESAACTAITFFSWNNPGLLNEARGERLRNRESLSLFILRREYVASFGAKTTFNGVARVEDRMIAKLLGEAAFLARR